MAVQILIGDALEQLGLLPGESVHCCVTSPPYFGLRNYNVAGQIGLEPSPDEYVARLVEVFREVRRVLRGDGTCWIVIGDSYASNGQRTNNNGTGATGLKRDGRAEESRLASAAKTKTIGLRLPDMAHGCKPKDLIGIPWMLACALRDDGWYLRQDIIWAKPNPMPESVTDRCTKAHEYVFLLSKSARYYYDADAIRDAPTGRTDPIRSFGNVPDRNDGNSSGWSLNGLVGRNRRSVWTVASEAFPGSHFAVFPPALIEPCVLAGCPKGGVVLDPFGGAGTTALVADRLGRDAVLIELNPAYAAMARARIESDAPLFAEVAAPPRAKPVQEMLL